ncbi:MAG: 4a-hydroxytetrahydrobiopterin dehydratase [Aphanocapsa feldmannii 277cI]|nr:MAG: 4a-hydroxytetrahydrobiopterin dehydratase [Aphanocapsa feldmannii 277cI]
MAQGGQPPADEGQHGHRAHKGRRERCPAGLGCSGGDRQARLHGSWRPGMAWIVALQPGAAAGQARCSVRLDPVRSSDRHHRHGRWPAACCFAVPCPGKVGQGGGYRDIRATQPMTGRERLCHNERNALWTGCMLLDEAAINNRLQQLGTSWARQGSSLLYRGRFGNFLEAMRFANAITPLAEEQGHHPDLDIGWGRCNVHLTTHDAGGLTEKDFTLAKAIDRIR